MAVVKGERITLTLQQKVRILEWFKKNFHTRVVPGKWNSRQAIEAMSRETGLPEIKTSSLKSILKSGGMDYDWSLHSNAGNPNMIRQGRIMDEVNDIANGLQQQIDTLKERVLMLERKTSAVAIPESDFHQD
jgi:hypothetical protein